MCRSNDYSNIIQFIQKRITLTVTVLPVYSGKEIKAEENEMKIRYLN